MKNNMKITEFTEDEYREFFSWLLEKKDVIIEKEFDISKCLETSNSYIYYTPEIKAFFETKPMRRLGKIEQITNVNLFDACAVQDRLEHCKGAYQKILYFYMLQFKKENWKQKNSSEDSRLKILADLMDMASHDIGHNICSHALEKLISNQKGAHEIIGDRILHENPEIIEALSNIHPRLSEYMDIVKSEEYNLRTLKEGNVDFDRADFLTRDSLYMGCENGFISSEETDTMPLLLDTIIKGCEIVPIKYGAKELECPVYKEEVEPQIETVLKKRVQNYKNIYISKYNLPRDKILQAFCESLLKTSENVGASLKMFLKHIAVNPIENINLDYFLQWNDIKFFNSLFEIIESTDDENLRDFALMCVPSVEALSQIVQTKIFSKATTKFDESGNEIQVDSFDDIEDEKFYKKVKEIIENHDEKYYKNNLANNCIVGCFEELEAQELFKEKITNNPSFSTQTLLNLIFYKTKIEAYNPNEPIFILGKDNKIYTFDEYPERKMDISTTRQIGLVAIKPKLRMEGINDREINTLSNMLQFSGLGQKVDMTYHANDTRLLNELMDLKYRDQDDEIMEQ